MSLIHKPFRLPLPDDYGTYWLDEKLRTVGAAIFPSRLNESSGKFHATDHEGFPIAGGPKGLRYFDSVEEALAFINELAENPKE